MEIVGQTMRWPYIGSHYLARPIVWQEVLKHDSGKYGVRGYLAMREDGACGNELMDEGEATRLGQANARAYLLSLSGSGE